MNFNLATHTTMLWLGPYVPAQTVGFIYCDQTHEAYWTILQFAEPISEMPEELEDVAANFLRADLERFSSPNSLHCAMRKELVKRGVLCDCHAQCLDKKM